jgi:hypothetical protein
MDYVLYIGIPVLIIILIILLVRAKKRSKDGSEALREIGASDPSKNYYVLSDIQFHDGIRAAKIDHLVINPSGIHAVIEYRYEGDIKGDPDDETWSYDDKGVYDTFPNPLLTAKALRQSIDKVLKKDYPVFIYIVFAEKATFKIKKTNYPVLSSYELKDQMNKNFKTKRKIPSTDVKHIYDLFMKVKNR